MCSIAQSLWILAFQRFADSRHWSAAAHGSYCLGHGVHRIYGLGFKDLGCSPSGWGVYRSGIARVKDCWHPKSHNTESRP